MTKRRELIPLFAFFMLFCYMLLVYTPHISPRFEYVMGFIFDNFLSDGYQITMDKDFFYQSNLPKIYYQSQPEPNFSANYLQAANLLFEKDIKPIPTDTVLYSVENTDYQLLFPANSTHSLLSYDIFAFCFLLLSRYEEYLPYAPDAHNRFSAKNSLSQRYNYLHLPIINLLAIDFIQKLAQLYPQLQPKTPPYRLQLSYDIDYMRAFLGKGLLRQTGALCKNFLTGQWKLLGLQIATLTRLKPDLYDTFAYLDGLHKKYKQLPYYFFLTAQWHTYDKNTPTNSPIFAQTVQQVAAQYPIGLHPSYQSNSNSQLLHAEKNTLAAISQSSITASRQHFLKLHLPHTYQNLLAAGIQKDFSMGYADACGFRAGTNIPFLWYDLSQNQPTNLEIYPLLIMDVTLRDYLKLSPAQALQLCLDYLQTVRRYGGNLSILFHNNSFCEQLGWQGWRAMYEEFLAAATE